LARHESIVLGPHPRGTIGGQITLSVWKGIGVAKIRPVPSNPNTASQQSQRNNFKSLVNEWHHEDRTATDKEAWDYRASKGSRPMSGFNNFIGVYRTAFKNGKTLDFLRGISVSLSGTTLSVTGKGSYDGAIKVYAFTPSGALITSADDSVSGGTFDVDLTLPSGITTGYVLVEYNVTNHFGTSGYYKFD